MGNCGAGHLPTNVLLCLAKSALFNLQLQHSYTLYQPTIKIKLYTIYFTIIQTTTSLLYSLLLFMMLLFQLPVLALLLLFMMLLFQLSVLVLLLLLLLMLSPFLYLAEQPLPHLDILICFCPAIMAIVFIHCKPYICKINLLVL